MEKFIFGMNRENNDMNDQKLRDLPLLGILPYQFKHARTDKGMRV
jgi:hypothetical protein